MSKTAACLLAVSAITACGLLSGCGQKFADAPMDPGICYIVQEQPNHQLKFNKLASNVQSLEYCAAALEKDKLAFLNLGSNNNDLAGAYQGHFLFLPRGTTIYSAERYDGPRYVAMVKYGDKLVLPGAVPQ